VKAVRYRVKVVRSVLEWAHGIELSIQGIFIPERGIAFNMADGDLHVFRDERERSDEAKEEIEVDDDLVELLETYLRTKERCRERAKLLLE
jgi:hypothetical protein